MTKIAGHIQAEAPFTQNLFSLNIVQQRLSTQPYLKAFAVECFGSIPQHLLPILLPIAKDLTDLIERKAAEAAEHTTKVQNEKPWLVLESSSAGLTNL